MLRICGTLRNTSSKLMPVWRVLSQQLAAQSEVTNPSLANDHLQEKKLKKVTKEISKQANEPTKETFDVKTNKSQNTTINQSKMSLLTHEEIKATKNSESLLKLMEKRKVNQQAAEIMLTQILSWINSGKEKLSDLQQDERFMMLCRMSVQPNPVIRIMDKQILGNTISEDTDHDADLNNFDIYKDLNDSGIHGKTPSLPLNKAIEVMSVLAQKKKRNITLLRTLSHNICKSTSPLNPMELSDLLYSMAILNFPDEALLKKAIAEVNKSMKKLSSSPIMGSISTSLGMLRYKNEKFLNKLSEWMVQRAQEIRPHDYCSFFMTLAILNHIPNNLATLQEVYINKLTEDDMATSNQWLEYVWALTVLDLAQNRHFASVLNNNFIPKLTDMNNISVPKKLKLQNINSAAQLLATNYDGPTFDSNESTIKCSIVRSKEKLEFVKSIRSVITNTHKLPDYAKLDVDFGWGFLIDIEFCIDSEGKPLPLTCDLKKKNGLRIAALGVSYYDMSRGEQNPLGYYNLYSRLLKKKGYEPLLIPYTEYNSDDKIHQRSVYINNRIKKFLKA